MKNILARGGIEILAVLSKWDSYFQRITLFIYTLFVFVIVSAPLASQQKQISFSTTEGTWVSLDVAPNGKFLAFELIGDIYTLPIKGGLARPILKGNAFQSQPRFSPNGKLIVYISDESGSDILFPGWALAGGPDEFQNRVNDPVTRRRLVSEMSTIFLQQTGSAPESIKFRSVNSHPKMQGRTLADFLTVLGRPNTIVEAVDAIIELQLSGGFIGIFEGMAEDDVIRIISHPTSMFETDGDLVELGMGFPHPRSYGSFPRILSKYVRDKEVLTLEEAIHKMTLLPALWIGQSDRGLIRKGAIADMTVFDFETIQDKATYNDPHHFSTGILHVFVGGVAVLNNNKITDKRPGRFIERSRN